MNVHSELYRSSIPFWKYGIDILCKLLLYWRCTFIYCFILKGCSPTGVTHHGGEYFFPSSVSQFLWTATSASQRPITYHDRSHGYSLNPLNGSRCEGGEGESDNVVALHHHGSSALYDIISVCMPCATPNCSTPFAEGNQELDGLVRDERIQYHMILISREWVGHSDIDVDRKHVGPLCHGGTNLSSKALLNFLVQTGK